MSTTMITLGLIVSILLVHFAYVDARFRYRDGLLWFWMLNPAPPLMWIARALLVVSVLFAGCLYFIGHTHLFFWVLGGLVAAHIISLILLEVLEPKG